MNKFKQRRSSGNSAYANNSIARTYHHPTTTTTTTATVTVTSIYPAPSPSTTATATATVTAINPTTTLGLRLQLPSTLPHTTTTTTLLLRLLLTLHVTPITNATATPITIATANHGTPITIGTATTTAPTLSPLQARPMNLKKQKTAAKISLMVLKMNASGNKSTPGMATAHCYPLVGMVTKGHRNYGALSAPLYPGCTCRDVRGAFLPFFAFCVSPLNEDDVLLTKRVLLNKPEYC